MLSKYSGQCIHCFPILWWTSCRNSHLKNFLKDTLGLTGSKLHTLVLDFMKTQLAFFTLGTYPFCFDGNVTWYFYACYWNALCRYRTYRKQMDFHRVFKDTQLETFTKRWIWMKKARNQSIKGEKSAKESHDWWTVKRRQCSRNNCQRGSDQGVKSLTKSGTLMEFTTTNYQLLSEQLWLNQKDKYLITLETN